MPDSFPPTPPSTRSVSPLGGLLPGRHRSPRLTFTRVAATVVACAGLVTGALVLACLWSLDDLAGDLMPWLNPGQPIPTVLPPDTNFDTLDSFQPSSNKPSYGKKPPLDGSFVPRLHFDLEVERAKNRALAHDTSWHGYVHAPESATVAPEAVLEHHSRGSVVGAQHLTRSMRATTGEAGGNNDGGPVVMLTRWTKDDEVPILVLDFGRNVAGVLEIEFAGANRSEREERKMQTRREIWEKKGKMGWTREQAEGKEAEGLPGISLAFSETLGYLSDRCDFTRSYNIGRYEEKITLGSDQIAVPLSPSLWVAQTGCQYPSTSTSFSPKDEASADPAKHGRKFRTAPTSMGKVCSDGLHGFRYLRISLAALASDAPYTSEFGQVRIKSVKLRLSAFHGTPGTFTGWFDSSDKELSQWWYQGVYTNDLCTDVFRLNDTEPRGAWNSGLDGKLVLHDGAKRDRDPYVGDLAVQGVTAYLSRKDDVGAAAVANVLADLAAHQRQDDGWIPPASIVNYDLHLMDYPLWWVVCVYRHAQYTANGAFAVAMYPAVRRALDGGFFRNSFNYTTGLLEKGISGSITGGYGDYAFIGRRGQVSYFNALYILALKAASQLSTHPEVVAAYGDIHKDGHRWNRLAESMSNAMRAYNWDSASGAFWDSFCGPLTEARWCDAHAQDANSLAILAGIVNSDAEVVAHHGHAHNAELETNLHTLEDEDDVAREGKDLKLPSAEAVLQHLGKTTVREWGNAFYDSAAVGGSDYPDRVYPFLSAFEVAARFSVPGYAPSALDQLRRTWGTMARLGPGTFWEGIGSHGSPYEGGYTSMAHGWSSGVVGALSTHVLGVEPAANGWGFGSWRVRPLAWEGMVPVAENPQGCVSCAAQETDYQFAHHWRDQEVDNEMRMLAKQNLVGAPMLPRPKRSPYKFQHREVSWAKGTVPAAGRGHVKVRWEMTRWEEVAGTEQRGPMNTGRGENVDGEMPDVYRGWEYVLSISAPRGTKGEVWVPVPRGWNNSVVIVSVDGEVAFETHTEASNITMTKVYRSGTAVEEGYVRFPEEMWTPAWTVRVYSVSVVRWMGEEDENSQDEQWSREDEL